MLSEGIEISNSLSSQPLKIAGFPLALNENSEYKPYKDIKLIDSLIEK